MPWFGSVMSESAATGRVDRRRAEGVLRTSVVPVVALLGEGAAVLSAPDAPCPAQADRPTAANTAMGRICQRGGRIAHRRAGITRGM
jgi:hypothetical protein